MHLRGRCAAPNADSMSFFAFSRSRGQMFIYSAHRAGTLRRSRPRMEHCTRVVLPLTHNETLKVGAEMLYNNFTDKDTRHDPTHSLVLGPTIAWKPSRSTRLDFSPLSGVTDDSPAVLRLLRYRVAYRRLRDWPISAMTAPTTTARAPIGRKIIATVCSTRIHCAQPSSRHNTPSAPIVIPMPMVPSDESPEVAGRGVCSGLSMMLRE